MKLNYFVLIVLSVFVLNACNSNEENKTPHKSKIVEVKTPKETNKQETQTTETSSQKTEVSSEKKSENVFEGTFEDASVLEMSYYLFFKDAKGKELTFYYNPQENNIEMPVQFMGTDLSVNKDLVGKTFKISFKQEKKEDDNTGEMTTINIPTKVEKK